MQHNWYSTRVWTPIFFHWHELLLVSFLEILRKVTIQILVFTTKSVSPIGRTVSRVILLMLIHWLKKTSRSLCSYISIFEFDFFKISDSINFQAAIWNLLVVHMVALTIVLFNRISFLSALFMMPYFTWLIYASLLGWSMYLLNKWKNFEFVTSNLTTYFLYEKEAQFQRISTILGVKTLHFMPKQPLK